MQPNHPMRRKDRAMDHDAAMALLEKGSFGTLATADAAGVPLSSPLSYVILNGSLYFHCAKTGQKLDNIAAQPHVCFSVVGQDNPAFQKGNFTTLFRSVIVHGTAALVQDEEERRAALFALCQKYLPDYMDNAEEGVTRSGPLTAVVRVSLDAVTGKTNDPG